MLPFVLQSITLTVAAGTSLLGLWRSKIWGWVLASLTDGTGCVLALSGLLQFPVIVQNPKWVAYSLLDFAAFALLLHRPVRTFFFGRIDQRPQASAPQGTRVLVYLTVAVVVTRVATSFALLLHIGEKVGGVKGFVSYCLLGFEIGGLSSFLFVLLLTVAGRFVGPKRLWTWLLAGVILAPGLTVGIRMLVSDRQITSHPVFGILLAEPLYLRQVPWLTIPAGLVAAFICFQMFPWGFGDIN